MILRINKFIIIFFLINTAFFVFSENWVGRVSTSYKADGSITASGDTYNRDSLTAACNAFKLGAEVYILNVKNKNKVIKVRINDRIDKDKDYFIILTPAASREIGINNGTELVVVRAAFSDVNSTEIISVNGLAHEGEIDEEIRKKFPEINWDDLLKKQAEEESQKKEIEAKGKPQLEKNKFVPIKKESNYIMDYDGNIKYKISKEEKTEKITPSVEKEKKPKLADKSKTIDFDENVLLQNYKEGEKIKGELIKEKKIFPNKIKFSYLVDEYRGDYEFRKFTQKDKMTEGFPEKEKGKSPVLQKEEKNLIDKDNFEKYLPIKKEEKEEIKWLNKIEKNKIYIRFSTSLNKDEGERRYLLFKQIFKNIVGIQKSDKYILYIGPVDEKEAEKTLYLIRKFGYKDALIIKGR